MDVKNVDPEAIALLERSFAERTRELPITLVHTGSVLEVLVSVVFVGKHLSTAFTPVAFSRLCQKTGMQVLEGEVATFLPLPFLNQDWKNHKHLGMADACL